MSSTPSPKSSLDPRLPERDRDPLPRYLAPLPRQLEDVALRYAWVIVVINLLGTAFGFWYYGVHPYPTSDPLITWQFALEPVVMWPFVPDSPTATLFIALSLGLWKLGRSNEYVNALAFFGCIKLGLWTPFVLVLFKSDFSYLHPAMYNFLLWSHLAMVLEAFVIYRYSGFPLRGIVVAAGWYGFNDLVDYVVPIVGTPHHTLIPAEPIVNGVVQHVSPAHELAGAGAVALTVVAIALAMGTRRKKLETKAQAD